MEDQQNENAIGKIRKSVAIKTLQHLEKPKENKAIKQNNDEDEIKEVSFLGTEMQDDDEFKDPFLGIWN